MSPKSQGPGDKFRPLSPFSSQTPVHIGIRQIHVRSPFPFRTVALLHKPSQYDSVNFQSSQKIPSESFRKHDSGYLPFLQFTTTEVT